ncbi:MAG TPA: hypothetical protein VFZ08_14295 [Terriglobia bacterium]|nr:hypothetical protein [Terriglobia bacterium]
MQPGNSFRDRRVLLDERAEDFLRTVARLGGYSTADQAQELGLANSLARTHARLKALERSGFLRRIAAYPVVYQVTKSVARLVGRDLRARRLHSAETVCVRLLAVNFYLEARAWPADFVFEHEQKIAAFRDLGCPLSALPKRGGQPYLREELVLTKDDANLCVAIIDWRNRSAFLQLAGFIRRFRFCLEELGDYLDALVVTGDDSRYRLFCRLRSHPSLLKLCNRCTSLPIRIHRVQQRIPIPQSTRWPELKTNKRQEEVVL